MCEFFQLNEEIKICWLFFLLLQSIVHAVMTVPMINFKQLRTFDENCFEHISNCLCHIEWDGCLLVWEFQFQLFLLFCNFCYCLSYVNSFECLDFFDMNEIEWRGFFCDFQNTLFATISPVEICSRCWHAFQIDHIIATVNQLKLALMIFFFIAEYTRFRIVNVCFLAKWFYEVQSGFLRYEIVHSFFLFFFFKSKLNEFIIGRNKNGAYLLSQCYSFRHDIRPLDAYCHTWNSVDFYWLHSNELWNKCE